MVDTTSDPLADWRGKTIVAFDTETTGSWPGPHRLLEIGAVRFQVGEANRTEYSQLIQPNQPIPLDVIRVHGITDDLVADSPLAEEVLPSFLQFIEGADFLIAHHAPFDLAFMAYELMIAGHPMLPQPVLDSCLLWRRFRPGMASYSLESLSQSLDLIEKQDHRALADARLVAALFEAIVELLPAGVGNANRKKLGVVTCSSFMTVNAELPEKYDVLKAALASSQAVEIEYRSTSTTTTRTIIPKNVYKQSGNLYMTAHCFLVGAERTFRVDRIRQPRIVDPPI